MFVIRDIQLAALGKQAREEFERDAYRHVVTAWPEQLAMRGEHWVRNLVTAGIDKAEAHGIDERDDVMAFLELVFRYGMNFEQTAANPWAPTILNMGNPGHLKIKQLQLKFGQANRA